jgi:hypothetical protein
MPLMYTPNAFPGLQPRKVYNVPNLLNPNFRNEFLKNYLQPSKFSFRMKGKSIPLPIGKKKSLWCIVFYDTHRQNIKFV